MGETFDDPNREAVGLAPIWTGGDSGGDGDVEPESEPEEPETPEVEKPEAEQRPSRARKSAPSEDIDDERT